MGGMLVLRSPSGWCLIALGEQAHPIPGGDGLSTLKHLLYHVPDSVQPGMLEIEYFQPKRGKPEAEAQPNRDRHWAESNALIGPGILQHHRTGSSFHPDIDRPCLTSEHYVRNLFPGNRIRLSA